MSKQEINSVIEKDLSRKAEAGEYLTFKLGNEMYGVEILKVQEIIGLMKITQVPKSPEFVRGVINLRGKVISVIDLRAKFNMDRKEDTPRTCIIVAQSKTAKGGETISAIVDEVSEVLRVEESQIEDPPSFGTGLDTDFIMGIGKVGEKVVMLLDVNKVFVC